MADHPKITDDISAVPSRRGETIVVEAASENGSTVGFEIEVGQLPKLLSHMMRASTAANEARGRSDPKASKPGDMQSVLAERLSYFQVGHSADGKQAGLQIALGGIPFTFFLSAEQAREMARQLAETADRLVALAPRKPN